MKIRIENTGDTLIRLSLWREDAEQREDVMDVHLINYSLEPGKSEEFELQGLDYLIVKDDE